MKYFSIYIPDPKTNPARPPTGAQKEEMDRFVGAAIARGEFLSGGGFLPLRQHGAIVRRTDGVAQVIDGPYAESKELVGGFAMLQYDSREAAIEGARRFMDVAGDGECITYCIAEGGDPEHGC
ncbi:YciI family protein [Rudaea sp.]|uniref:YciI family protein n=1 Tax=Rudaea sp. TaxID=2136325 RepID=UPI002ED15CD7